MDVIRYSYPIGKEDFVNAGKVSSLIKQKLKQFPFSSELIRRMAVACYEAELNVMIHSYGGSVTLEIDENEVRMVFADIGPGIADLKLAMTPGYSTASVVARELGFGAGMGLPNIAHAADSFDIQTSNQGTTLHIGFKAR